LRQIDVVDLFELPCDHLAENGAQREDVTLNAAFMTVTLFWSHVPKRAEYGCRRTRASRTVSIVGSFNMSRD
jgi:hypothetical protein